MEFKYEMGELIYIPMEENKNIEISDDETDSDVSETSVGIKDPSDKLTKNTTNDMDSAS